MTFPGGGGGGRGGGGGGGEAAARRRTPIRSTSSTGCSSARALYAKQRPDPHGRLDARAVPAGPRPAAGAVRRRQHRAARSATRSRGPSATGRPHRAPDAARMRRRVAGFLKAAQRAGDPHERADAAAARRRVPRVSVPGGRRPREGRRAVRVLERRLSVTSRNVPFQAGRSVAWGLDHDAAIQALTINAAKILGVDSQVGSIETGKLANLVVAQGRPARNSLADSARRHRRPRCAARQQAHRVVQAIHGAVVGGPTMNDRLHASLSSSPRSLVAMRALSSGRPGRRRGARRRATPITRRAGS